MVLDGHLGATEVVVSGHGTGKGGVQEGVTVAVLHDVMED